jgi:hypothetical protein
MNLKLNAYWKIIHNHAIIFHVLDPRFKLQYNPKPDQKDTIKLIEEVFENYEATASQASSEGSTFRYSFTSTLKPIGFFLLIFILSINFKTIYK